MKGQINSFLCQRPLEVRMSKKTKPYLVCDDCGIQVFVRFEKGMKRLEKLLKGKVSFSDTFVLCRDCRVAVERCAKKISGPLFRKAGIYCPECDELLLEKSEVDG
jgi:hypothetical protein